MSVKLTDEMKDSVPAPIRHWAKIILRTSYRRTHFALEKVRKTARHTLSTTDILGPTVEFVDSSSFVHSYADIFRQQVYRFRPSSPNPLIVDAGSNIGLSVIYFKLTYPGSRVIAFEADAKIFEVMKRNCAAFGFEDVELNAKAVWNADTPLEFLAQVGEPGRVAKETETDTIRVPACRLRDYLDQPVDLLKVDIEGAEAQVLPDCEDRLHNVRNIIVESHDFIDKPQT